MVESFWALPDPASLRTPLSILREQAAALTEQTHGLLVGEAMVHGSGVDNTLDIRLDVIVPALNDYRYRVLTYRQPVELYPGMLWSGQKGTPVANEAEFVATVRAVLSSEPIKNVLTSLRAQIVEA